MSFSTMPCALGVRLLHCSGRWQLGFGSWGDSVAHQVQVWVVWFHPLVGQTRPSLLGVWMVGSIHRCQTLRSRIVCHSQLNHRLSLGARPFLASGVFGIV